MYLVRFEDLDGDSSHLSDASRADGEQAIYRIVWLHLFLSKKGLRISPIRSFFLASMAKHVGQGLANLLQSILSSINIL